MIRTVRSEGASISLTCEEQWRTARYDAWSMIRDTSVVRTRQDEEKLEHEGHEHAENQEEVESLVDRTLVFFVYLLILLFQLVARLSAFCRSSATEINCEANASGFEQIWRRHRYCLFRFSVRHCWAEVSRI